MLLCSLFSAAVSLSPFILAAVSCRKEHRNSPTGRFKRGFDEKSGNPRGRDGFIVTCKRNSDCYNRCPQAHPLTGDSYQCQTR